MDAKINVDVHIRKNDTGEIRVYKTDLYSPSTFIWEEGNYSCDCNRRLFFARACGEEEDWESGCGESEYSVEIHKGDKILYSEFEAHPVGADGLCQCGRADCEDCGDGLPLLSK